MGRISNLIAAINDDWHVTDVKDSSTMQPAQIFVQGDLTWDQLQVKTKNLIQPLFFILRNPTNNMFI